MSGPLLFQPLRLRDVEIPNRLICAPMCQYSAIDGVMNDWHLMHLGQFAVGGGGLTLIEATGVEPEGRITPGCVGLWDDETQAAIARVVKFYRDFGHAKIGIQLAHAGRKASAHVPWKGGTSLSSGDGAWQTFAPSAVPYGDGWHVPEAFGDNSLARVREAFVQSTRRAAELDLDVVEIHAAHGYLMHQFLSPISNKRDDSYGGSLENRMRFPLEVFDAVREVWPKDKPVGVRFSATDWIDGGWHIDEAVVFAKALADRGCDFFDVSSGGLAPEQQIKAVPGYQTGFAQRVRSETQIPVMAVGRITEPMQAETILQTGQADMIAMARGLLYDPRWAWHAAEVLHGAQATFPPQYARSHPTLQGEPVPGNPPTK